MQTKIVQYATRLCLVVAVMSLSVSSMALEPTDAVKVTSLMKTRTSWDGQQIAYPQGMAEVTAMRVEIAPGGETGWHSHSVPSFAVIIDGTLEVALKDGRVKKLQAGDVLAEVVNTLHNGHNTGAVPVRLVVFYPGVVGQTLTVKER
jgi:quercetin dioxygenase-like cupin family protein